MEPLGRQATAAPGEHIDPFGFDPRLASCIAGLGGDEAAAEHAYVFRSVAVVATPGKARFTLRFRGLEAGSQILLVELLNRAPQPGNPWARSRIEGVHLQDVIAHGGEWHMDFQVYPDIHYAVAGYIHDEGEVRAEALELTIDAPFSVVPEAPSSEAPASGEKHGLPPITTPPRISGPDKPSFANPSSQPWTPAQARDPAFRTFQAELMPDRASSPPDPWDWAGPFVLHALSRYQAMTAGRRGLGIGIADVTLAAAMIARGCTVNMLDLPAEDGGCLDVGQAIETLVRQRPGEADRLSAAVGVSMFHPLRIPDDFRGQADFAWWIADLETPYARAEATLGVMLAGLKPGGMAILILPFRHEPRADRLGRPHIERLALDAISNGHMIAQLRFDASEAGAPAGDAPIPYALIVRRGA